MPAKATTAAADKCGMCGGPLKTTKKAAASIAKTANAAPKRSEPRSSTIRHKFTRVNEVNLAGESSGTKMIGGFPWRLMMVRHDEGYGVELYLVCDESKNTPVWHCDFDYVLTIKDQGYGMDFVEDESGTVSMASNAVSSEHISRFLLKNGDADTGAVYHMHVVCQIKVKEAKKDRFRPNPSIDFFTAADEKFDCELSVGAKKIHVNKQFLASRSGYFKDLFYGAGQRGDEKAFKLKGIKADDLIALLNYLYRVVEIGFDNYDLMADRAKQFLVHGMKDEIELFMLKEGVDQWSEASQLNLAEKLEMPIFMEAVLDGLRSRYEVEEVMESDLFEEEFSEGLKKRVEERLVEIEKKEKKKK